MSPQTVLLRTTLTWVIIINLCIDDMTPGFRPFTVKFFYKFHVKNNTNQFSFFSHSFLLGLVGKFFMPSLVSVPPSSVQTSVHFLMFSVFFQKNYVDIQLPLF